MALQPCRCRSVCSHGAERLRTRDAHLPADGRRARAHRQHRFGRDPSGKLEFGYWIARPHWGRGYATEAGRAVIAAARDSLRIGRLNAGHFLDNPASGRVLQKLGFRPTGQIVPRFSLGRRESAPCRLFELELGQAEEDTKRMAA